MSWVIVGLTLELLDGAVDSAGAAAAAHGHVELVSVRHVDVCALRPGVLAGEFEYFEGHVAKAHSALSPVVVVGEGCKM